MFSTEQLIDLFFFIQKQLIDLLRKGGDLKSSVK